MLQYNISPRKLLLALSEAFILFIGFSIGASIHVAPPGLEIDAFVAARGAAAAAAVVCIVILGFQDLYEWRISMNSRERNQRLVAAFGLSFVILAALFFYAQEAHPLIAFGVLGEDVRMRMWRFFLTVFLTFTVLAGWRTLFHSLVSRWQLAERVLVVGTGELAMSLAREIADHRDAGFEIAGMVPGPNEKPRRARRRDPHVEVVSRPMDELYDVARERGVRRVVVALQDRRSALPVEALLRCRLAGLTIEEREVMYERVTGKIAVEAIRPSYLIFGDGFHKTPLTMALKRVLDILASATGLILSLPITIPTAILIKLDSPGPLFYRQPRVGKDGRHFEVLKFRSMRADAEKNTGPVWARAGDDRVTRVGRFIRKTRIDEIPQMWCVLRGEMSFVGPRPERPFFVDELAREIPFFLERQTVKPGITGWAQINYPYGSSKADAIQKLQYDLFYIKNMSVFFDLLVIFRTIKVVVLRKGAV
ncbi:MAG: TIGR03013 family PEP-CTERM/XrtA system glycosyltransferase [Planctomycetes bacterium]|nr:TIGR03013 family PEP-CTERM/XrtA system glycosyltransferase [Planctomycetota bacterium]